MKKYIVFIPAYNAEKTIAGVLDRIPEKVWKNASEILIQDNNSRDKTVEVAQAYKRKHHLKKLTIIKNEGNIGYGGTKKKAFAYSIKKGYDILVMVHADGQYPPENIYDMINPLLTGKADLVIGSRIRQRQGGMQLWKLAGNRLLTFLENLILGMSLVEFHSGYKAYNLHALSKVPYKYCSNDHAISSETIIQFRLKSFRIREITIPTYYGTEVSQVSLATSARYGLAVFGMLARVLLIRLHFLNDRKFPRN